MIEVSDPFNRTSGNKNLRLLLGFIAFLITVVLISVKFYYGNKQQEQIANTLLYGKPFKSVLKDEGYAIDIGSSNPYEILLRGNKYSNMYFGVVSEFPSLWEVDRGVSELSVIRAFNRDSALTIALLVFPFADSTFRVGKNAEEYNSRLIKRQNNFQNDPVRFMNENSKVDYLTDLKALMKKTTILTTYNYEIKAKEIRDVNYVVTSYFYDEVGEDYEVTFKSFTYETFLWGNKFSFIYAAPVDFLNQAVIEDVLHETKFINSHFKDFL